MKRQNDKDKIINISYLKLKSECYNSKITEEDPNLFDIKLMKSRLKCALKNFTSDKINAKLIN